MKSRARRVTSIALVCATLACVTWLGAATNARAASLTVPQVIAVLRSGNADLSGVDLSRLDLSDVDMSGADLSGANLFGADLTGARLVRANLAGANLDRAIIIRADFSGANLSGSRMLLPSASPIQGENPASEAPSFNHADLSGAHLLAKLGNGDWTGANLSGAHFEMGKTEFLAALRSDLSGCKMAGANLEDADLSGVRMAFADLRHAHLARARFDGADMAGVRLDGADLAGASLANADLSGASLRGVIGLDQATGLASARNLDLAER